MLDATAQPQWTLRCQPFHLPGVPPSSRTFGCKMSVVLTMKLSEHVVPKSSKMSPWHSWNPWWLEARTWGSPMTYRYPLDPKGGKYTPKTDQNWSFRRWKMIGHGMFVVLRTSIVLPRRNNSWSMCSWLPMYFHLRKHYVFLNRVYRHHIDTEDGWPAISLEDFERCHHATSS